MQTKIDSSEARLLRDNDAPERVLDKTLLALHVWLKPTDSKQRFERDSAMLMPHLGLIAQRLLRSRRCARQALHQAEHILQLLNQVSF